MKITKDFLLSDSSVNVHGFRLLTTGYLIEEFRRNPIGYHMHAREAGVVVRWENLRVEGDKVLGNPFINMSNPMGQRIVDEINNGFLNAASVGHFVILEVSDDANLKLLGQTGPTVTKWFNRECSLVDIPGNMNSLVLYDGNGELINLSALSGKPSLQAKMPHAKSGPMSDAAGIYSLNDVAGLISQALKRNTISVDAAAKLKRDYADKPNDLRKILCALDENRTAMLSSLSWEELDKKGLLQELKERDLATFKLLYKAKFKKDYKTA